MKRLKSFITRQAERPIWRIATSTLAMLVLATSIATAQNKYEREYRIDEKEVPEKALEFVQAMKFNKKIKWYREESLKEESIEAKTKYQGYRYSIEFDLTGEIEDIEKKIKWKEIPEAVRSNISDFFDREHQKIRLSRIQVQFTGKKEDLIRLTSHADPGQQLEVKYEIVIKARTNNEYDDIEYLFSETGEMEKKAIILSSHTDNLEY